MLGSAARDALPAPVRLRLRCGSRVAQSGLRSGSLGRAVQPHHAVELLHPGLVDGAGQPVQRGDGARIEVVTIDEHGVITWEELAVVGQHDEAISGDLGVGGVDVGDVDLSGRQRAVGEVVIDPAHRDCAQAISGGQRSPAIGAVDEFVRYRDGQAAMPGKVGDGADALALRHIGAHCQRIAVAEPQRSGQGEALPRQRGADGGIIGQAF